MTAADAGAAFAGISDEDWTSILHPDGGQLPSEASNIGPYPAGPAEADKTGKKHKGDRGTKRPEPLTELGFARRLIKKHGDQLRFVVPWNRWLVWDGTRWAPDADGHVQRCMKVIAREVHTSLIRAKAEADMIRAAKRAESSAGVKGALTLAATELELAITPERLDAHPYLLNCRNGVVDLQTGELLEHDPALLLTRMAGAPTSRMPRAQSSPSSSSGSSPARTCGCSSAGCSGSLLKAR